MHHLYQHNPAHHHHHQRNAGGGRTRLVSIAAFLFLGSLLVASIVSFHHLPSTERPPFYELQSLRGKSSSERKISFAQAKTQVDEAENGTDALVPEQHASAEEAAAAAKALPRAPVLSSPSAGASSSRNGQGLLDDAAVINKALTLASRRDWDTAMSASSSSSSVSSSIYDENKGAADNVILPPPAYREAPGGASSSMNREEAAAAAAAVIEKAGGDKEGNGMWQKILGGIRWKGGGGNDVILHGGGGSGLEEGTVFHLGGERRLTTTLVNDEGYLAALESALTLEKERHDLLSSTDEEATRYAIKELLAEVRGNRTLDARSQAWKENVEGGLTKRLWTMMEKELPAKDHEAFSFIEWIGEDPHRQQPYLGLRVAKQYANGTVLSARSNATSRAISASLRAGYGLNNLLLSSGPPAMATSLFSESFVTSLQTSLGYRPCSFQFFHDISMIASTEILPHEVETVVGHALALCQTTFLPSHLPTHRFFGYWESVRGLVDAAAKRLDLKIDYKTLDRGYHYSSWRYYSTDADEKEAEEEIDPLAKLVRIDVEPRVMKSGSSSTQSGGSSFPSSSSLGEDTAFPSWYSASSSGLSAWIASSSSSSSSSEEKVESSSASIASNEEFSTTKTPSLAATTCTWFNLGSLMHVGLISHDKSRLASQLFRLLAEKQGPLDDIALSSLAFAAGSLDVYMESIADDKITDSSSAATTTTTATSWGDTLSDVDDTDMSESDYLEKVLSHYNVVMEPDAVPPPSDVPSLPAPSSSELSEQQSSFEYGEKLLDDTALLSLSASTMSDQQKNSSSHSEGSLFSLEPVLIEDAESSLEDRRDHALVVDEVLPDLQSAEGGASLAARYLQEGAEKEDRRRRLTVVLNKEEEHDQSRWPSDFLDDFADGEIQTEDVMSDVEERKAMSVSLSSFSRKAQAAMAQEQGPVMEAWYNVLIKTLGQQQEGQSNGEEAASWSILLYGARLGLTSLKLAKHYPRSLLVSATPEETHVAAHVELLDLLQLSNNLIAVTQLSPGVLGALEAEGTSFDYQVLSHDAFTSLLRVVVEEGKEEDDESKTTTTTCNLDRFEKMLGSLLSLSSTTFLEVPSMGAWLKVIDLLLPPCSSDFRARYLVRSSYLAMGLPELQLLNACLPSTAQVKVLKRSFSPSFRPTFSFSSSAPAGSPTYGYGGGSLLLRIDLLKESGDREGRSPAKASSSANKASSRNKYSGSMTLSSLQHLGLIDEQRGALARMFLTAPLWRHEARNLIFSPDNIRYHGNAYGLDLDGYLGAGVDRTIAPVGAALIIEANNDGDAMTVKGLVSLDQGGLHTEAEVADNLWEALKREIGSHSAEIGDQKAFSIMELGSGHGLLSLQLARSFRSATVLSLEDSREKTGWHYDRLAEQGLWNNVVCNGSISLDMMQKLYESPEFLRYLILRDDLLLSLLAGNQEEVAGEVIAMLASSGLTTFLRLPTAAQASLALTLFVPQDPLGLIEAVSTAPPLRGPLLTTTTTGTTTGTTSNNNQVKGSSTSTTTTTKNNDNDKEASKMTKLMMKAHPLPGLQNVQSDLLRHVIRNPGGGGKTKVLARSLRHQPDGSALPLIRLDIMNMTRHVHHHFDHKKDGHTRTYTMHVVHNASATQDAQRALSSPSLSTALLSIDDNSLHSPAGEVEGRSTSYQLGLGEHITADRVISVHLHRDSDQHFVPYTSIQGVTLIAILRLGLLPRLRDRAYGRFLALPLYEDMAPWNIIFRGADLDYIDYDTRSVTYDALVPKIYQILSVLMNYKRTIQDFKRCSPEKARTPYGFAHVSDCVGGVVGRGGREEGGNCKDPALPVPCPDGRCHSDYISCLRGVEVKAEEGVKEVGRVGVGRGGEGGIDELDFDDHGLVDSSEEEGGVVGRIG